ncbi:MAG TPA: M1 family metallopeptidase [Candidatus Anoxymicrobiaceae bacterium]
MSMLPSRDRTPVGRSLRIPRRTIATLLVASVLSAILGGCGGSPAGLSSGDAGMQAARVRAGSYLTAQGRQLARGRTAGATVYSVSASLDTADNSITGRERVLFTNRTGDLLSQVVFRVYANDAGTQQSHRPTVISDVTVDSNKSTATLSGSIMKVSIPSGIKSSARVTIAFGFNEPVPAAGQDGTSGLFAHEEGTYDLGNFLPTVVRYVNGAWDTRPKPENGDLNYFDVAYYTVSFSAPSGYVVAATGVEEGGSSGEHRFAAGPVRDFEAQVSNLYRSASRQVGDTTVTSYYYQDDSDGGADALTYGCQALSQFSSHFGPYPYARLSICEGPLEDYGMEYTGPVVITSSVYESTGTGSDLDISVAHEVCHQWWAIGVGSDPMGSPWMDESLTSFCEVAYSTWQYGQKAGNEALQELAETYASLKEDDLPDAPVVQPESAFTSGDQYTAVVYGKGALFFNELWKQPGQPAFDKSLLDYYRKNVFLNASPEDLLSAFRANSPDPSKVDELLQ